MEVHIKRNEQIVITTTELAIVQMLSYGLKTKMIAHKLLISPRTVEAYMGKMYLKVKAESQAHLVAIFIREGLIDL